MTFDETIKSFSIGESPIVQPPLGFGGSWYMPYAAAGPEDVHYLAAMQAAYDGGLRHFDTGAGYGHGHSEELYGRFLGPLRDKVFIASKANPAEATAQSMYDMVVGSLQRLGVEKIDLYYIHWPRTGWDMRPSMEGLERARSEGKIGAVGVSNFSVAEMEQVREVGTVDAHQLGYNLLWRYLEADTIPYCAKHGIKVLAYSTLSHGILTGKFGRDPGLKEGDQRHSILPFRSDIWPHVFDGVERLKALAAEARRPLAHLAIRWVLAQQGLSGAIIGGRNAGQVSALTNSLEGAIAPSVFARMTAISDEIIEHIPRADNLFGRVG